MPKLIFVHENKNVSAGWLCEEDGNKLILRLKCKESATFNKNREIFRIDIGQMYSFEELQLLFEQALEIDLEEMWEVANSFQSDLSLHDLVVLIFGAYSAENLIKAAYRFAVDQIYFVIRDSKIIPRSREAVLQKKIELAKRQALESKAHNFVEWLKNANSNNIDLDLINSAIKYALDNESQDSLFDIVKAKLGIKSESLRTLILKNLYARNIITPLTNLPFIASNIQKEGIAIDELSNSIEMFEIEDKSEAVSVDNPETRDIDDAFYFESSEHNYKVAVYISNVAPHITLGTLNKLSEHPSSIYMPDMIVHMFKEHLATEVFSLKENHRKRALRISATFDENFSLKDYSVDFVILQVSKNLTYEVFEGLLRNKYSELLKLISALKKHRESNGAIEIRRMEVIPVVSSDGKIKLKTYQKTKAHETIEELMILSNVLAAKYLIDNEIPGIFRYQTIFDKKICEEALKVQNLFVRNYKLRTTLPKSEFTVEPKPHNGLGVAYYCQITSPIRRFFDLLCQFQVWLKHMGKQPLSHSDLKRFISIASPNLEAFLAVQRNSKRFYTLRYLEQEKITHLRGIPVQKLNQGYIFEVLDYDLTCLVQTSKHFDLGEEVKLKIESLNPERLNIFLSAV